MARATTDAERRRFARAEPILDAALELEGFAERLAYVAAACEGDVELRAYVERLLRLGTSGGGVLEHAAVALVEEARSQAAESGVLPEGTMIGRFRVTAVVGSGGMGCVYRAEGRTPDEIVAVKVLHAHLAEHEAWVRRFDEERRILEALHHPQIAALLDGGTFRDRPWFATTYVDGVPIDRHADSSTLPVGDRVRLLSAVAGAVEYAHSRGVVHRDLTPSNILVTRAGEVRLVDFGIGKLLDGTSAGRSSVSRKALTPGYASPEQLKGQPPSAASDLYQLGVVLYELASGSRPFAEAEHSLLRWSRAVVLGQMEAPSARAARAPCAVWSARGALSAAALSEAVRHWDAQILCVLALEPSKRPATAAAFAALLATPR